MIAQNSLFYLLKPSIPKRFLLFVAAAVWTFAGGMLLYRGFSMIGIDTPVKISEEVGCIIGGVVFYVVMFSKISAKHVTRILNLPLDKPCLFSFFNWHSYFMMLIMISFGVTLRLTGIVPIQYLSLFYIAMGTPLFMSSIRFYLSGFKNLK
jgi:hypothetical protein